MVCWDIRKSPEEGDVELFLQSINSRTTSASVLLVGLHLDALDSDVEGEKMWLPPGSKGLFFVFCFLFFCFLFLVVCVWGGVVGVLLCFVLC